MAAYRTVSGSAAQINKKNTSNRVKKVATATSQSKATTKAKAAHCKANRPQRQSATTAIKVRVLRRPAATKTARRLARQCQTLPAAKAGRPVMELKLTVVAALSGRCLANLDAALVWKVAELKKAVGAFLEPGKFVKSFLLGEATLPEDKTLAECSCASGSTVQAILASTPVLFLASPCSASELSRRRGSWRWTFEKNGHDVGREQLVISTVGHHSWEEAPVEARQIAEALRNVAPNLGSRMVCLTDYGLVGGEVIIIANATEDPRFSCLQALQIPKLFNAGMISTPFIFRHPYEFSEDEKGDRCWRSMQRGQEGEGDSRTYSTWLKHKDDPVYHRKLWGLSTLRDADFKLHVSHGFNEAFEEAKRDAIPGFPNVKGINPFTKKPCLFKGKPGQAAVTKFKGKAKQFAAQNIAATQVMAGRLQHHFKFDFACRTSCIDEGELIKPLVEVAPVIYGGYAPDGSIVGILTSRAKAHLSSDEDQSDEDTEFD